jgi:hypothetical protein
MHNCLFCTTLISESTCIQYSSYSATNIPFVFSFSGNCAASVPISTFMCLHVNDLCIPRIGPHISCSRIGRSINGTIKWITDRWMWKLGLWLRNSFSGNTCFQFSVLGSLQCTCLWHTVQLWRWVFLKEQSVHGRESLHRVDWVCGGQGHRLPVQQQPRGWANNCRLVIVSHHAWSISWFKKTYDFLKRFNINYEY